MHGKKILLKIILPKDTIDVKCLNLLGFNNCIRLFFTLFLFTSSFLLGQKKQDNTAEPVVITLSGGAEIFSINQEFNNQVAKKDIVIKNAEVSYQKNPKHEIVLLANAKSSLVEQKDFSQQVKLAKEQKQKEELKEVQKKIKSHKLRENSFLVAHLRSVPSTEFFNVSSCSARDCIVVSHTTYDFSKFHSVIQATDLSLNLADVTNSKKYIALNSKSFDYCFSEIFSVRPPPMTV